MTATTASFLEIASREIAAGIPVIPIQPGQKAPPLNVGGTTSASTNPEQIVAWATRFPDANVGVVCTLTGILIVDDDDGIAEQSGLPIHTRIVESSPGHRQYYFRHTAASAEVGNIPQRAGFSLRSHNYYGLAADSRHPNGHFYKMLNDSPIQPMPAELLRYLQERYATAKGRSLDGATILQWGPLERKLGPGEGRNDDMTRLAGLIWDGEISEEDFTVELSRVCAERHDPPYPEGRITDLVRRAMRDWKPSDVDRALLYDDGSGPEVVIGRVDDWRGIFHTYLDFVNAPKLTFAIKGWLQQDGLTMLGGLAGHGKTWIMLQMVRSLLTGESLFGYDFFKVTQKSERVVYLVPEVSIGPFKYRLEKSRLLDYVQSGKLLVRTLSSVEDIPLSDERIRRAASGADVFLDTCTRFFDGDEKSAQDAKKFAATLFALQRAGARTLTGAHHSPKALTDAKHLTLENVLRGSGDLGAMLATCWGVWQQDEKSNRVYVRNVKPRDFEPVEPFEIQGRPHIDETGWFKMAVAPGLTGGKSRNEGRPERPEKLNVQAFIRSRKGESVSEMYAAACAEGFEIPFGTFKTWATEVRKMDEKADPDDNSARLM